MQSWKKTRVLRLGFSRDNRPYIVPVSFGYDGTYLYIHTAREGMKIEYISANRHVCFEREHDVNVIRNGAAACRWTKSFYCVIGFATIEEITDAVQKADAMNRIMMHYSGREWTFDERLPREARLWRITVDHGKEIPGSHGHMTRHGIVDVRRHGRIAPCFI